MLPFTMIPSVCLGLTKKIRTSFKVVFLNPLKKGWRLLIVNGIVLNSVNI
jgi:hypothetical protein